MNKTKSCPVVQFEIGCRDAQKTGHFYHQVFGWELGLQESPIALNTGSLEGINGFLTSLGHEPHNYVNIYIRVGNMSAAIESVRQEGGNVLVGPLPIPNGRTFAWITDPEGNMLGLIAE